jgi:hypothetical protein
LAARVLCGRLESSQTSRVLDAQSAPAPTLGRSRFRPEPPLQKGPLQTRKAASLSLGQPRKSGARRKSAFGRPDQIVFVSTQSPEARHAKFGMARCPATHKVQRAGGVSNASGAEKFNGTTTSNDQDELRRSDVETLFVCEDCGKQGADLRPISTGTEGAKLRCAIASAMVNAGQSDSASQPRKFSILISIAPVHMGRFTEGIGKPNAGSKSIGLAGSFTAGNGFDSFCREAVGGDYVEACPCILRRQWACGVWGRRCAGRRVCPGVALRSRVRRWWWRTHRRWTG